MTIWKMAIPWWEFVIRATVVYGLLLGLLRLTGKRQIGQLAPFDLVLLLLLSNAEQNSMNARDNSLIGGLVSAGTLVGLNFLVGMATYRSKRLEAIIEGKTQVLVHKEGCSSVKDVRWAILENDGSITVLKAR